MNYLPSKRYQLTMAFKSDKDFFKKKKFKKKNQNPKNLNVKTGRCFNCGK